MELSSLKILIDVARLGSFAEAARKHDKDPSSISRTIASIEKNLSIALFKRSTRVLSLTEAGAQYVRAIEPLVSELDLAADVAQSHLTSPHGLLTLTASNAFGQQCILPLMPEFCARYPDIDIDLRFTDANLDLLSENIDLACRLTPDFTSDLIGVKLFPTQYQICASPGFLAQHEHIEHPSEISKANYIAINLQHYRNRLIVKSNSSQEIIATQPHIMVSSAIALKECLLQGLGYGLAADWLVKDDIEAGRLVSIFPTLQITATDFSTAAWLLYPSRRYLPAKTRVLIEFLKEHLRN